MVSPFKKATLSQKVCDMDKKAGEPKRCLKHPIEKTKRKREDRGRSSMTPHRRK